MEVKEKQGGKGMKETAVCAERIYFEWGKRTVMGCLKQSIRDGISSIQPV